MEASETIVIKTCNYDLGTYFWTRIQIYLADETHTNSQSTFLYLSILVRRGRIK
jgi:hypothetical protein